MNYLCQLCRLNLLSDSFNWCNFNFLENYLLYFIHQSTVFPVLVLPLLTWSACISSGTSPTRCLNTSLCLESLFYYCCFLLSAASVVSKDAIPGQWDLCSGLECDRHNSDQGVLHKLYQPRSNPFVTHTLMSHSSFPASTWLPGISGLLLAYTGSKLLFSLHWLCPTLSAPTELLWEEINR